MTDFYESMGIKTTVVEPRPSGQRAVERHQAAARQRTAEKFEAHQLAQDVARDAREAVEMANRERRLRPVYREDYHLVKGRPVPVMIRREFPYGPDLPVAQSGQAKSMVIKLKSALLRMMSAFSVTQVFKKEDSK